MTAQVTHLPADVVITAGQLIVGILAVAGLVASGVLIRLTQKRAEEWKDLAEARYQTILDQGREMSELKHEVGELKGRMLAMEAIKAEQIARRVVDLMGRSALILPDDDTGGVPI